MTAVCPQLKGTCEPRAHNSNFERRICQLLAKSSPRSTNFDQCSTDLVQKSTNVGPLCLHEIAQEKGGSRCEGASRAPQFFGVQSCLARSAVGPPCFRTWRPPRCSQRSWPPCWGLRGGLSPPRRWCRLSLSRFMWSVSAGVTARRPRIRPPRAGAWLPYFVGALLFLLGSALGCSGRWLLRPGGSGFDRPPRRGVWSQGQKGE